VGVVGLPLLTAGAVLALRRRPRLARAVALMATGLTALCALALLPHAGDSPAFAVEWLPGAGSMGLTTGATGLYAVLVTTWGAFLVMLAPPFIPPNGGERGGSIPPNGGERGGSIPPNGGERGRDIPPKVGGERGRDIPPKVGGERGRGIPPGVARSVHLCPGQ